METRLFQASLKFELHLLESGISGDKSSVASNLFAVFELHLLESGISGNLKTLEATAKSEFELHLLESGISGNVWEKAHGLPHCLNSTYWNLVFQGCRPCLLAKHNNNV